MPVPSGQIPPLWAWRATDWGIEGGWPSWRARVLGGCSAHNGCFIVWGPPADYDDWAQAGNPGWSHAALDPYRRRAEHALRARPSRVEDLEPLERAGLEGAAELGLPLLEDFDDPQATEGAAAIKVNAVGAVRWNAAFAYLDPARERPNLTIMADTLADRLHLEGSRVAGVIVGVDGREVEVAADRVVVAAGAYGPPAVLLRSGVGPAEELAAASVTSPPCGSTPRAPDRAISPQRPSRRGDRSQRVPGGLSAANCPGRVRPRHAAP
jgi:choline dehydrogenase